MTETLRPENLSKLSKEKVKAIHQRILPDVELREVSQSLKNVADVIKGKEADCNQFQLMKQLILMNEEDYKATITALARIVERSHIQWMSKELCQATIL